MTPLAKKLLILSCALMGAGLLFLVGLLPASGLATGLLVLFPAGASIFGVFLVVHMLGKEAREFDQEDERNLALARSEQAKARSKS